MNSDPTAEMALEEFENDWQTDEETAEQERIVHNIKVTKVKPGRGQNKTSSSKVWPTSVFTDVNIF